LASVRRQRDKAALSPGRAHEHISAARKRWARVSALAARETMLLDMLQMRRKR
jgi:hypothetical protein